MVIISIYNHIHPSKTLCSNWILLCSPLPCTNFHLIQVFSVATEYLMTCEHHWTSVKCIPRVDKGEYATTYTKYYSHFVHKLRYGAIRLISLKKGVVILYTGVPGVYLTRQSNDINKPTTSSINLSYTSFRRTRKHVAAILCICCCKLS